MVLATVRLSFPTREKVRSTKVVVFNVQQKVRQRMVGFLRPVATVTTLIGLMALGAPLSAQQPAPTLAGSPSEAPTKKDPLRFTAFNVSMPTGVAGVTEITIERWSTVGERKGLLEFVETAKYGEGGQRKLLDALQKVKPRVGFIRTPNSLGWDLRYAAEFSMPDGTRQIVIGPTSRSASAQRQPTRAQWTTPSPSSKCG
jgi:hypothetical protein